MSTLISNRYIPSQVFEQARLRASEERAKAMAEFFTVLGHALRAKLQPRPVRDVAFRFQNHGLWRGI